MGNSFGDLRRTMLRRLIMAESTGGVIGRLGGYYSHKLGWPLSCGLRIIIDNPSEWIQGQLLAYGIYEPNITKLLTAMLAPGDVFFDIGANIGYHSLVAAACGARVHAFEPVPRIAKRLGDNLLLNQLEAQVSVIQVALSNYPGEATLYVAERADDGSHSLLPGVTAKSIELISVQTITLDTYLRQTKCGTPTVIKVDVEGCESLVLDGASSVFDAPESPIWIIETGDRLANQLGESAAKVLNRLFARGYRVFLIPDAETRLSEVTPGNVAGELSNYLCIPQASPKLRVLSST